MCIRDSDQGVGALVKVDVPADWKNAVDEGNHTVKPGCESCPSFVQNIAQPINAQAGYDLPVSTFAGYEDGTLPAGTAKFEKRGPASVSYTHLDVYKRQALRYPLYHMRMVSWTLLYQH